MEQLIDFGETRHLEMTFDKVFAYDGTNITFARKDGAIMVNATQMAKKFGKRPVDWLENQQTTLFLDELSKVRKSTLADLVRVTKGGNKAGTWMHEDVALEFARWLSPAFAIWCNDRIKELLTTGAAILPNFSNPAEAARAWAEQFEYRQLESRRADEAEQQVLQLTSEIESMQPKASYYDLILNNKSTVTITQIAQDYGMSAKAFNKILNNYGVQHKVNDQWILYAKFLGKGYVQSKAVEINTSSGLKVKYNTEWTQKGRIFLYHGLKNHGILPLIER